MYNEDEILYISDFKDLTLISSKIKKVVFNEGFKKINYKNLMSKNLKALDLPSTLEEIDEYAFADNDIREIILGENLKKLGRGAFQNNSITKLSVPNNLENIGPSSFKDNEIEVLELSQNLKSISYSAFQNNRIKKLVMNDNLEEIGNCAFCNNLITEIVFNDKLKKLPFGMFDSNKLTNINIPSSVVEIHNDVFANNQITSLVIPDTVKRIDSGAFKQNKISNLVIGKGLKTISGRCFYNNCLTSVEIPSNIKSIETNAFMDNQITNLKLNEGLETIGARAFYLNNLTSINIPSTVTEIGVDAFNPCDVYVGDIKLDKKLIEKFGTNMIIKLVNCKKEVNSINYNNINKEALALIPVNNDALKGLNLNITKFNTIYDELNLKLHGRLSYNSLFKLGYILGAFKGNKLAYENIVRLAIVFSEEELNKMTNQFEIDRYDQKFADTINSGIQNSSDYNRLLYLIPTFYNNIDRIKKGVLKQKENKIAKLNQYVNEGKTEYKEELDHLKKSKKAINLDDVEQFILTGLFQFSEENKDLFKYAHLFNGNIDKKDIPKIEEIYEQAKKLKQSNFNSFEETIGDYTYAWVMNTDPVNLVLGYLVNCCAKYKGAGEDIMIQSMTNPNLKNLVVYKGSEVVAKSTAFYNNDYILCNNIEVSDAYNLKSSNKDKAMLLSVIVKALKTQATKMDVNEVRVGLLRNDLFRQILEARYSVEHKNLLSNYKFKNYMGDANDPLFGQAILYKK